MKRTNGSSAVVVDCVAPDKGMCIGKVEIVLMTELSCSNIAGDCKRKSI